MTGIKVAGGHGGDILVVGDRTSGGGGGDEHSIDLSGLGLSSLASRAVGGKSTRSL